MITYVKDKNNKSKKKLRKYETLTTILKSFDTFVIIATTSSSITFSLTDFGLIVTPISTATACGLSLGNNLLFEIVMQKCNKYKEQYDRDVETNKSFDDLYRKSLQDKAVDKKEYESLCNIFINYLNANKTESF